MIVVHPMKFNDEGINLVGSCTNIVGSTTRFSEGNQVHTYMHARIKFHAYSDI
jgi:hypothetical protein